MKILTLILFLSFTLSNSFTGKVIKITDGDTIVVLTEDNEQIKIRLEGIDCPESSQDFGTKAKQATSDICFGKQVKIIKSGEGRYGRTLGYVMVGDVNVNEELLRLGMAWHYKQYNKDPELTELEQEARTNKVGLWSQANPIAPWEFRRR